MQGMSPDAALPCLMCSSCLELGIPILSLGNSPGAAAAALCFSPEEQNKKIFVLNKGHGWGITDWCFAVFGKMLSCSSLHRKFWKLVLRGGLTLQVYMQEKFSPLKRIFFCISSFCCTGTCSTEMRWWGRGFHFISSLTLKIKGQSWRSLFTLRAGSQKPRFVQLRCLCQSPAAG